MAIRWDKLTVKAQEAFQRANDLASEHGNPEVMPVHLLAALLEDREGIVLPLLGKLGAQANAVQQASMREIERLPKLGNASAQAHLAPNCWTRRSSRQPISRTSMFRPNTFCWRSRS